MFCDGVCLLFVIVLLWDLICFGLVWFVCVYYLLV